MRTLLILTILSVGMAFAEDKPTARHIDFTRPLIGVDGKTISSNGDTKVTAEKAPAAMTLGDVVLIALESTLEEDRQATGAEKFKLDELARRVYHNKDAVLPVEDIATIKTRVGKAFGPLVVGAAWRLLDPAEATAEKK